MAIRPERPLKHAKNAQTLTAHSHLFHWIRSLDSDPKILILQQLGENTSRTFVGEVEKMYIAALRSIGHRLINLTDGGDGLLNPNEEVRAKMRTAAKSRFVSQETRDKMSRTRKGRVLVDDVQGWRKNVSAALKGHEGHKFTQEQRAKITASLIGNTRTKGSKQSEETRAQMRASHLRHNAEHPETNDARRASCRRYWSDPANREKARLSHLGKKYKKVKDE